VVDDSDFESLSGKRWRLDKYGYAVCGHSGRRMHRIIMQAKSGEFVDHKNGNPLDNQRTNLRFCTRSLNAANSKLRRTNTTGFKGVWKDRNYFRAEIKINQKKKSLGYFPTPEQAHAAYIAAAKELFGDFARAL